MYQNKILEAAFGLWRIRHLTSGAACQFLLLLLAHHSVYMRWPRLPHPYAPFFSPLESAAITVVSDVFDAIEAKSQTMAYQTRFNSTGSGIFRWVSTLINSKLRVIPTRKLYVPFCFRSMLLPLVQSPRCLGISAIPTASMMPSQMLV